MTPREIARFARLARESSALMLRRWRAGKLELRDAWTIFDGGRKYVRAILRGRIAPESDQAARVGLGGCRDCPRVQLHESGVEGLLLATCGDPGAARVTPEGSTCGCPVAAVRPAPEGADASAEEWAPAHKAIVSDEACGFGRWGRVEVRVSARGARPG